MRAASVAHVEYELFKHILETIDVSCVQGMMAEDEVSEKRFNSGGVNVMQLLSNLADRRRHKLPKSHVDYKGKEE